MKGSITVQPSGHTFQNVRDEAKWLLGHVLAILVNGYGVFKNAGKGFFGFIDRHGAFATTKEVFGLMCEATDLPSKVMFGKYTHTPPNKVAGVRELTQVIKANGRHTLW